MDTQLATLIGPLSVNGVLSRRAKGPPMGRGVAPHASSDMFKGPVHSSSATTDVSHAEAQEHRDMESRKPSVGTVRSSSI